jgi:adenosylhomocysteine nucleosidase
MQVVDFAIVCALEPEFKAVVSKFKNPQPGKFGGKQCVFARFTNQIDQKPYRAIVVSLGDMGNLASLHACSTLLHDFSPRYLILVGICGGLLQSRENFRLGDVVLSDTVVYYEPGKDRPDGFQSRAKTFQRSKEAVSSLFQSALTLEGGPWTAPKNIGVLRPHDSDARERPHLKTGTICSGEKVIANDVRVKEFLDKYPEAISVEMEAAGVAHACQDFPEIDFLIVKAVSDPAGDHKNDEYREYACATAAAFLANLLTEAQLPPPLKRHLSAVPLADLFRLKSKSVTRVILGSYDNPRHRDMGVQNYPFNVHESAFDDVYCALRIMPALEASCGRGNVHYHFDREIAIPPSPNRIILGSSISNMYTHAELEDMFFQFGTGMEDHDIVSENLRFAARFRELQHPQKSRVLDKDYGLISVRSTATGSVVVLAGCRAYGQLFLGDFLSDANLTDDLLQKVPENDFQCILRVNVSGRNYQMAGIERIVVRGTNGKWHEIPIEAA